MTQSLMVKLVLVCSTILATTATIAESQFATSRRATPKLQQLGVEHHGRTHQAGLIITRVTNAGDCLFEGS